jgi:hypothetical protein
VIKQILTYVTSFITVALVLAGIGGASYHTFKEGGWFGVILGKIWDVNMDHPVIAIPVTLAVLVIGKLWYDHNRAKGYTSKLPNAIIYLVMAAGAYYIWVFVNQGSL